MRKNCGYIYKSPRILYILFNSFVELEIEKVFCWTVLFKRTSWFCVLSNGRLWICDFGEIRKNNKETFPMSPIFDVHFVVYNGCNPRLISSLFLLIQLWVAKKKRRIELLPYLQRTIHIYIYTYIYIYVLE